MSRINKSRKVKTMKSLILYSLLYCFLWSSCKESSSALTVNEPDSLGTITLHANKNWWLVTPAGDMSYHLENIPYTFTVYVRSDTFRACIIEEDCEYAQIGVETSWGLFSGQGTGIPGSWGYYERC
ncbi:MAG: hypothetical protein ACP5N7_00910, partial [Candidatus Pacearchaeota archaeon]